MRKLSLLIISLLMVITADAQFTITSSAEHLLLTDTKYNIDAIAIFNSIPAGTTLNYTGGGNFTWSYTIAGETYTSTQTSITPEDAVQYTILINGVPTYYIYVIDYSLYPVTCSQVITDVPIDNPCEISEIDVIVNAPDLQYVDRNGNTRPLPRFYHIAYTTSAWDAADKSWKDSAAVATAPIVMGKASFVVPAILQDAVIAAYGDSLAVDMGLPIDTCYGSFQAVAVQAHPIGTIIERDAKNEKDRSSQASIQGSAPLVVQLKANPNPLTNPFVEWFIWNVTDSNAFRRFADETVNYTFEETGDYKAKVVVQNGECSYTETLEIRTMESLLEVPNVFTPNDDGINDEFRVAYKSIKEFHIWIYNRWGRLVYKSTDPAKGWDGRINGKPASVGTYYYIINAYGEDKNDKGKRVHYKLSGDCNLLR
ncbi:MAG: gliding motility-associated C-terminal domain-containing protein [Paludibacteraceae bacterium]|nr:gliding motility-associated C-terminal domain-containing protein [Paludibacteraceae bacterium]